MAPTTTSIYTVLWQKFLNRIFVFCSCFVFYSGRIILFLLSSTIIKFVVFSTICFSRPNVYFHTPSHSSKFTEKKSFIDANGLSLGLRVLLYTFAFCITCIQKQACWGRAKQKEKEKEEKQRPKRGLYTIAFNPY